MPYFVCILYGNKDGKLYAGCTTNIKKRLEHHNAGNVPATKNRRPLVLIHSEKFSDKAVAFNRERFMKSLWSGRLKKKVLKKYLDKIGHK